MRITIPRPNRIMLLALTLTVAALTADAPTYAAAVTTTPDYWNATWIPANPANFTVADRPHDYPVDMVVIHDIEGTAQSAINAFQDPNRQASAHYVVSKTGAITQMVAEKDIAWHAGNWDYNTRAIGIEHEGYAYIPYTYTVNEYKWSARLLASICSRWGVPLDRNHVIGHYQVPDPYNPGLYGGSSHHTDPGPYWDWVYYMNVARQEAAILPSPPHMVLNAVATAGNLSAAVTWPAARTCRTPIASYHVVGQPGNIVRDLPGNVTTTTFAGLQAHVAYTFTVTAKNSYGQDSLTTNAATPYTVPSAPSNAIATAGNGSAVVTWTAPSDNGGRPVIGYRVTPILNGTAQPARTFYLTSTMEVVSGLTDDSSYTFVVAAINIAGAGASSTPSNSVTPSSTLHPGAAQSSPAPSPPPRT